MNIEEVNGPSNIDDQIRYHADMQEEIDSDSISNKDSSKDDLYQKMYASHYVIETILKNYKMWLSNKMSNQIFMFEYDNDNIVAAALHAEIKSGKIELKWIASTFKGGGSKLISKLKRYAYDHKIKGISLTSKFNSDKFYKKMGGKKTGTVNPLMKAFNQGNKWWLDSKD